MPRLIKQRPEPGFPPVSGAGDNRPSVTVILKRQRHEPVAIHVFGLRSVRSVTGCSPTTYINGTFTSAFTGSDATVFCSGFGQETAFYLPLFCFDKTTPRTGRSLFCFENPKKHFSVFFIVFVVCLVTEYPRCSSDVANYKKSDHHPNTCLFFTEVV
jgi:hypothetical protein